VARAKGEIEGYNRINVRFVVLIASFFAATPK
jgi:hypothetical protein